MHTLSRVSGIVTHIDEKMHAFQCQTDAGALNAPMASLPLVCNRDALLSMLFRETDRVQRMKTPLCLMLFAIDHIGDPNSTRDTRYDALLSPIAERVLRILRSYDVLGRLDDEQFLAILPGCGAANATMLAERLRGSVFAEPFHSAGEIILLSASFGIASSQGRSPMVVLREAEQALNNAKDAGPGSIACFGSTPNQQPCSPFSSPDSKDEPLAW
ncbi:MAG TPA: GGDEF domain-containing protein [Terracidiphilus sp.]|jgi:diguanylate cyclase (GGDEF)-like protein|nr:GGDEF domain-containing protein [Terracidiphilus sp.]